MNIIMGVNRKALSKSREYRKLKNLILEELGISEEVKILTGRLVRQIVSEYHQGYEIKFTPFSKKCGEYTVVFDFADYPSKVIAQKNMNGFKAVTFFPKHRIIINGYTVRGKIPEDMLAEVLQHELKHIFDLYKSSREGFFKSSNDAEVYRIAAIQATNDSLPDELRAIGYAVYLSHNFEDRAFESGTYAYLMRQNLSFIGDEIEKVKDTMYYKRLMFVRYAYDFINENRDRAEGIATSIYGKTLKWLKKTVTASLNSTRRQIGRAVAKVRNDYDWTHGGENSVWI